MTPTTTNPSFRISHMMLKCKKWVKVHSFLFYRLSCDVVTCNGRLTMYSTRLLNHNKAEIRLYIFLVILNFCSYPTLQNTALDSVLFRVHATDADTGSASVISYKIDQVSLVLSKLIYQHNVVMLHKLYQAINCTVFLGYSRYWSQSVFHLKNNWWSQVSQRFKLYCTEHLLSAENKRNCK